MALKRLIDLQNKSKREICLEAIGTDSNIDYALPQDWLNAVADKLLGQYSYDDIRVSIVMDYRSNTFGMFRAITIEGLEILAKI